MADEKADFDRRVDLCHPEILELSSIRSLLTERGLEEETLKKLSRPELLSLYYKVILPLPQRIYCNNRRGKFLTKRRLELSKQTTSPSLSKEITPSSNQEELKNTSNNKSEPQPTKLLRLVNSPKLSVSEFSRIKPPPITISTDRKTIKLSSKRDLSGNDVTSPKPNSLPTTEQESGRKIIRMINDTLQSNAKFSNNKRESILTNAAKKVISLKNNQRKLPGNIVSSEKVQQRCDDGLAEESTPKKKHRPITWP